jgi:hypothetical protein
MEIMKLITLIFAVMALSGCDITSYFNDKKINVKGFICEVKSSSKFERKTGTENFILLSNKNKSDKKYQQASLYFTLTENIAANFSKNRESNQPYYELRRIDNSFRQPLTINVWPQKNDRFTSVKKINNGYEAVVVIDEKIMRRNTEIIEVNDAFVGASMWDFYADLETFSKRASSYESTEKLKEKYKDTLFPLEDFQKLKLNRISGKFSFEDTRYLGEREKPDTRQAVSSIYSGLCRAGLAL